jgi:hypothetical protein
LSSSHSSPSPKNKVEKTAEAKKLIANIAPQLCIGGKGGLATIVFSTLFLGEGEPGDEVGGKGGLATIVFSTLFLGEGEPGDEEALSSTLQFCS